MAINAVNGVTVDTDSEILGISGLSAVLGIDLEAAAGGGGGSFAFIAQVAASSANGISVTTGAIDTTGANLLIMAVSDYQPSTASTVSDSKGNTWNALTESAVTGGSRCRIMWCVPTSVGSGHTFGATGSGNYPAIAVMAFSGAHASPFDQQSGATSLTTTSLAAGSITPSQNDELIIAALSVDSSISSPSLSGYTLGTLANYTGGGSMGIVMAYKIQTTASAENPSWGWTSTTNAAVRIASFKDA